MKSLEKLREAGPSGYVFGSSVGGHEAVGVRNLLDDTNQGAITFDDSFDMASVTKIMSTTAILMELISHGDVELSTEVSSILPQWKDEKKVITIENLLRHRSGLAPWRPLYIRHKEPQDVHEFIAREPLKNKVDSSRSYSDLGFITLARVIEVVTGLSLNQAFEQIVRTPFGLHNTCFAKPATEPVTTSRGDRPEKDMVESNTPFVVPELSEEFSAWRSHPLTGEINDGNAFHIFDGTSGHAGLFSTASDLLSFAEEISQHSLFRQFTEPGPDEGFHLGFMSWTDTVGDCTDRIYGHTGFTGVAFGISEQHHEITLLLSNRLNHDGVLTPITPFWQAALHEFHSHLH